MIGPVLRIPRDLYDAVVAHARRDHPDEACGVLAGPAGSGRPERLVPMLNAARSPTYFEFESGELLRLDRDLDARGEDVVVVYHSHTATEAYPSRTDTDFASNSWPAHWLLVSTRDPERVEVRSFRITAGEVSEEPVEVINPESDATEPG